jgi:hypothetical protein
MSCVYLRVSRNLNSYLQHPQMAFKTHILRLISVVEHGVGGPEAGSMDFLYSYLLQKFGQDVYKFIRINQVGNDLEELILKEPGNAVHINIKYPAYENFELKSVAEQNRIRLDVVHVALMKIAEEHKKLDIDKLQAIKREILEKDFKFSIVYRTHVFKRNPALVAKILVVPEMKSFRFYCMVEKDSVQICNVFLYEGIPQDFYMERYFYYGKWKNENLLVISGKEKIVEIHVTMNNCTAEVVNLTRYANPPYFQLMKAGLTEEDKSLARKDWEHSLPPAIAAIINHEPN